MFPSRRGVAAIVLVPVLALIPAAASFADHGGGDNGTVRAPDAITQPATQIASDGVTLQGTVRPRGSSTTYRFEYGTTDGYGQTTPVMSAGDADDWASVAEAVTGLTPAATYHFRVVATNGGGTESGEGMEFTTGSADGTSKGHRGGSDDTSPSSSGDDGAKPELGKSVGLELATGIVRVRKPDDTRFGALEPGGTVPTGTVIDASQGKVTLTTAVTPTATQTATFWGGVFEVRQRADGGGYTDIHLRGASLASCPRPGAAAAAKRRRPGGLWAATATGASVPTGATASPRCAGRLG